MTIPPYQDLKTLAGNLCLSPRCVELWVARGILPPPVVRAGKRLWRWAEVEQFLSRKEEESLAVKIRDATMRAAHRERQLRRRHSGLSPE
jgi:predicted site-specific integrase-resolvase